MQKFFGICLLSITSLMLQGAEPKSRPGSDKRKFLSQSDLAVERVKQQEASPLAKSDPTPPIHIPQPRKKCNDVSPSSFTELIGSPSHFDLLTFTTASKVFTQQKHSFDDNIPK